MKPIIIIGAARSGTKLLRGIFSSHPDIATFPSEIDYIWKYGNEKFPTDELTEDLARPDVRNYIHEQFQILSKRHSGARVVEKSVSNSLRVRFVSAVFPEAYFVHLIRDGRANVESVRRSWESGLSLRYFIQKFKGVNWIDAFHLAPSYFKYHMRRKGLLGSGKGVNGPHFEGMEQLLETRDFLEVCGIQWKYCVQAARENLQSIPAAQVIEIRYEDLVINPTEVVESLFDKVGLDYLPVCKKYVTENVHATDLDKWKTNLSESELMKLLPHISSELEELGYGQ